MSVGVEGGVTVSDPVSSGSSVCRCRGGGGSQSQTLYPLVVVSVGVEGGRAQSQTLYPLVVVSVGVERGHSLRPCILWWQCL